MKKAIALILAAILLLGLLAGCTPKANPTDSGNRSDDPSEASRNDGGAEDSGRNQDLSILWSSGGNGEYVNYTVDYLTETYGLDVEIEYNAKAHEVLQPQIIAGNPPDVVMVQHSFFNYYEAIQAGAFTAVNDYLDLPVNGSDKTVREVANSDIIDSTSVDGKTYLLMSNMNVNGIYYDKAMFDEHGWEVPRTWDEFLSLCEEIKTTTDIAPFAYPGMYPYYLNCFVFPQLCTLGNGTETFREFNNMAEGFWVSEPVRETFERIEYMRDHGYFLDGLISLSHTETQMEFINGHVAMLACGSWLENEMAGNWPDGFELAYMETPAGDAADGETYVVVTGNMFAFPSAAENKDWIGEFLQTYYSADSAAAVTRDCGVVISPEMVVEQAEIRSALSPSVVESYESANANTKLYLLASLWYPEFWTDYQNTVTALVSGEIDAETFCRTVEAYAAEIRADENTVKYSVG